MIAVIDTAAFMTMTEFAKCNVYLWVGKYNICPFYVSFFTIGKRSVQRPAARHSFVLHKKKPFLAF